MSYFTNPFAPNSQVPVFASSPLNPLPSAGNSFPIPASLRRSSLVRSAPPLAPSANEFPLASSGSASPAPQGLSVATVPSPVPSTSGSSNGSSSGGGSNGGVVFTSPFGKTASPAPGMPTSRRGSLHSGSSRPTSRGSSQTRRGSNTGPFDLGSPSLAEITAVTASPPLPYLTNSRRGSLQSPPAPLRTPSISSASHNPFFSHVVSPVSTPPATSGPSVAAATSYFLKQNHPAVDFSRRRSVDVGVLGLGTHRPIGAGSISRRVREAVGPDAGDKETGFVGSNLQGGKDRMLGRHLKSILAHSLALCADPPSTPADVEASERAVAEAQEELFNPLDAIPGSPVTSAPTSRNTSITESSFGSNPPFIEPAHPDEARQLPAETQKKRPAPTFPVLSEAKRFKLIGNLQSWTFNAMSYSSDELLSCVGIMFESVRNMEGVTFDLDRLKALLISLRSAYHARNGYHNFSHATDVTQACYSFLVRMGLAPPLYLLCEDDYDANAGEGRRKWRRNRAVEEGGMGELLRPMDVFALMVAAIGHDVGHPGLSNAYMVNARTPVAQVYDDKSVLENFHTVTLIHMLRRHNFDYLLGGDFGHLGEKATSFRKVVEASILATDMSRHFAFVNQLNDLGRRFGDRRNSTAMSIEEDRLLLCSGLIKCADISNPTRPHRISRAWSTALLDEWTVQAAIETEFGLPVSVMTLDPNDTKAQAKSQVGFIDLFAKPLFNAMAGVVDEFADFAEKLRDGRIAWEAISLQADDAFRTPVASEWKLPSSGAAAQAQSNSSRPSSACSVASSTPAEVKPLPTPPIVINNGRQARTKSSRPNMLRLHSRQRSDTSSSSANPSPRSPSFPASSVGSTGASSVFTLDPSTGDSLFPRSPRGGGFHHPELRTTCGGACQAATATCETCSRRQDPGARRESLGRSGAGLLLPGDEEDYDDEPEPEEGNWLPSWPFLPGAFQPQNPPPAPAVAAAS